MPTISVNNETEQMVEEIQEHLFVSPTKKKTVEKAVKQLYDEVMENDSVISDSDSEENKQSDKKEQ